MKDITAWNDQWDDDNIEDDFSLKLREQIENAKPPEKD